MTSDTPQLPQYVLCPLPGTDLTERVHLTLSSTDFAISILVTQYSRVLIASEYFYSLRYEEKMTKKRNGFVSIEIGSHKPLYIGGINDRGRDYTVGLIKNRLRFAARSSMRVNRSPQSKRLPFTTLLKSFETHVDDDVMHRQIN